MGCVPPAPGFLEALRALCDASGALLVFDEVITGFRVARGGAQERFGVMPDLTILGKIVGGGLPLAAFGGRAEIMSRLAPVGDVYQAGTLSGNPLATAAGLSVLRRLRDPAVYDELERRGARLEAGLAPFGRVQRVGAMLTLLRRAGPMPVTRMQQLDTERYGALFRHLLDARDLRRAEPVRVPVPVARPRRRRRSTQTIAAVAEVARVTRDRAIATVPSLPTTIAAERAPSESPLWAAALRRRAASWEPVFSPLAPERFALGLETIYEAYLVHYGRPRLFAPGEESERVLLGDYLYAHGLVRVSRRGRRRGGRGDGRADLPLRLAARGRRGRRRRGLGRRGPRARRRAVRRRDRGGARAATHGRVDPRRRCRTGTIPR